MILECRQAHAVDLTLLHTYVPFPGAISMELNLGNPCTIERFCEGDPRPDDVRYDSFCKLGSLSGSEDRFTCAQGSRFLNAKLNVNPGFFISYSKRYCFLIKGYPSEVKR